MIIHLEHLKQNDQERYNLVGVKVHYFQVVELVPSPYEERKHMESLQAESDIQIHHKHLEYGWLRLPNEDIKERLESHIVISWVETVGEEELAMNEEKVPKVHRDYQIDYMGIKEISQKDCKKYEGETT